MIKTPLTGAHTGRLAVYPDRSGRAWAVCDTDDCWWRSNTCKSEDGARKAWARHLKRVGATS